METFGSVSPRTNLAAKAYGERVKSVANDLNCYIVDAFSLLGGDHDGGEAHYGQYLEDGLHLNESGNNVLYKVRLPLLLCIALTDVKCADYLSFIL